MAGGGAARPLSAVFALQNGLAGNGWAAAFGLDAAM